MKEENGQKVNPVGSESESPAPGTAVVAKRFASASKTLS
jgi:hypothetical protein